MIVQIKENLWEIDGVPNMFPFDRIGGIELNVSKIDEDWYEISDILYFGSTDRHTFGYRLHRTWFDTPLQKKLDLILNEDC